MHSTYHYTSRDVIKRTFISLVLVYLLDVQGVHDCRQPIDELIKVHARGTLARRRGPLVLGQLKELVEFGSYEACNSWERPGESRLEGSDCMQLYRTSPLYKARAKVSGKRQQREVLTVSCWVCVLVLDMQPGNVLSLSRFARSEIGSMSA